MKSKLLAGLAALALIAAAPAAANAQTSPQTLQPIASAAATTGTPRYSLNPFQLVNLAYEGGLQAQGIRGHGQLENDYAQHRVNAQALVNAGIEGGYVSASTAQDGSYLNAVRSQMRSLNSGSSHYVRS